MLRPGRGSGRCRAAQPTEKAAAESTALLNGPQASFSGTLPDSLLCSVQGGLDRWPGLQSQGHSAHVLARIPTRLPLGITAPHDPFRVRSKLLPDRTRLVLETQRALNVCVSCDGWTGRGEAVSITKQAWMAVAPLWCWFLQLLLLRGRSRGFNPHTRPGCLRGASSPDAADRSP